MLPILQLEQCFSVINAFLLTVTLCNKSSFVSSYFTLFIQLVSEHPFCSNNFLLRWFGYQILPWLCCMNTCNPQSMLIPGHRIPRLFASITKHTPSNNRHPSCALGTCLIIPAMFRFNTTYCPQNNSKTFLN